MEQNHVSEQQPTRAEKSYENDNGDQEVDHAHKHQTISETSITSRSSNNEMISTFEEGRPKNEKQDNDERNEEQEELENEKQDNDERNEEQDNDERDDPRDVEIGHQLSRYPICKCRVGRLAFSMIGETQRMIRKTIDHIDPMKELMAEYQSKIIDYQDKISRYQDIMMQQKDDIITLLEKVIELESIIRKNITVVKNDEFIIEQGENVTQQDVSINERIEATIQNDNIIIAVDRDNIIRKDN